MTTRMTIGGLTALTALAAPALAAAESGGVGMPSRAFWIVVAVMIGGVALLSWWSKRHRAEEGDEPRPPQGR
jgi:hypothetical protein